jgi:hypothetical protein
VSTPLQLLIEDLSGPWEQVAAECSGCGAIPVWRLESWVEYRLGERAPDDQGPQRALPPPVVPAQLLAIWQPGAVTVMHCRATVYDAQTRCQIRPTIYESHLATARERETLPRCPVCFPGPPPRGS